MRVESNLNLIDNNLNWKILMLNLRKLILQILDVGPLKQKVEVEVGKDDIDHNVETKSVLLKNMRKLDLRAMSYSRSLLA
jgi:hypothetical protein